MDSSNFWKLDKIDKIGIALIFIVFAIYSTFSCFAAENVDIDFIIDRNISNSGVIVESSGRYIGVVELEPGYTYTFTASDEGSNVKRIFFGDSYNLGDTLHNSISVESGDSYSFTANDIGYMFFVGVSGTTPLALGTITREKIEGMSGAVDNLSFYAGFNLWESFSNTIVYALPITITCFGIFIICGFIKRFSKGV